MKKFLIAILIMLSAALLFSCNNKNATLVSAQKVGTKGNFDVYQLTYSNGFESLIEVGDNTIVESISVVNGGIVYNYYNSGNTTNDDELPRKGVSTNKDEASDKTEESTDKEESTNNNSTISGTLTDGTVIFNGQNSLTQIAPIYKVELNTENIYQFGISNIVQIAHSMPACEHSFGEYVHMMDASCSMYGEDRATCSKCNCTISYYTAKLEHDYDITVTLEEALEVMKAEKKSGKILSIGFQPRGDVNMQMIKKIVDSGVLGKIYYLQSGGGRQRGIPVSNGKTTFIENETAGIGALGDIGCYSLDMLLNAIGYPKPLTVTGYKSAFFGTDPNYTAYVKQGRPDMAEKFGVDDFAAGFVRLEGDIILDFRISWAMNMDTPGDALILGTKGGLRIPSTNCWNGTVGGPMKIYHEVGGEQVVTEIPILKSQGADLWCKKVRSFIDACKNGGTAPVPTSQIVINQAIIDGICRSAELGREIEIEIPEV